MKLKRKEKIKNLYIKKFKNLFNKNVLIINSCVVKCIYPRKLFCFVKIIMLVLDFDAHQFAEV